MKYIVFLGHSPAILPDLNTAEYLPLLAMQYKPGLSDALAKKLIFHFNTPTQVLAAKRPELQALDWFPQHLLNGWNWAGLVEKAKAEMENMQKHGIGLLAFNDTAYPKMLQQCVDGPLLLFYKGEPPWHKKRWVSIVGTRRMTRYGQEQCEEIVRQLMPYDPVIVSGLAYGVDITAHKAALDAGLSTVACLANGLDGIYPAMHKKLARRMLEQGALLSETWTQGEFHNKFFIRRNRIIAGLSEATIVVESAVKGGSLTTADMAFSYDRLVYAVPGRLEDSQSVGCNNLIAKQLAQLFTTTSDFVADLGWDDQPAERQMELDLIVQEKLTAEEKKLFAALSRSEAVHIEALRSQLSGIKHKIASMLLSMELKGWVKALPGQMFKRY